MQVRGSKVAYLLCGLRPSPFGLYVAKDSGRSIAASWKPPDGGVGQGGVIVFSQRQ